MNQIMPTRRSFLRTMTSGFLFGGCNLFGLNAIAANHQSQSGSPRRQVFVNGKRCRTIDMHAHSYVHDVWPLIKDRQELQGLASMSNGPMALDARTINARLQEMDRQGIDVQAISISQAQYHYWADPRLASRIVRIQNEKLAEVCAARPDRFVGLGSASMQHPDLAAEQMEYGVKKLNMHGFMIGGSVNGDEISNSKFDPFWKKAEELGIVIFIHPSAFAPSGQRFAGHGLDNTIGFPLETTVALSHMIFEGFLDRFAGIRIVAAHGGGYLPSYIGRSDNCNRGSVDCQTMKRKPSDYLRGPQLYFDALVYSPANIKHLVSTVGASQIVVGSDFAFGSVWSRSPVDDILQTSGLTPDEQIAILGGNAARLLKLDR
jgi:aminocarboxymuconate-semialdehyde decarboxylase